MHGAEPRTASIDYARGGPGRAQSHASENSPNKKCCKACAQEGEQMPQARLPKTYARHLIHNTAGVINLGGQQTSMLFTKSFGLDPPGCFCRLSLVGSSSDIGPGTDALQ